MKKLFVILIAIVWSFSGCKKDSGFGLEIYQLKAYQAKSPGQEIIAGSERLPRNPLIYYHDIIYYDSTYHYFKIDSLKARELFKINWPVNGTGFALTINRQVIYSGYLIPGYSSSGCGWYSIDPLSLNGVLWVWLGYPGDQERLKDQDPRNDERIIEFLKADNKLNH